MSESGSKCLKHMIYTVLIITTSLLKILIEGFIILTLGTSDKNGRFHPFGYAISKTERDDDFARCFNALKKGIRLACDSDYSPNCLIADNADAISNAIVYTR